jgi:hypothetical protein
MNEREKEIDETDWAKPQSTEVCPIPFVESLRDALLNTPSFYRAAYYFLIMFVTSSTTLDDKRGLK